MKITIERKYQKTGYTIGLLYVNGTFVCNTLEPTDRGLDNASNPGRIASEEWQVARLEAKRAKAMNKPGTTAIPRGLYRIRMRMSAHFEAVRPFLGDVPGFEGIMIHEGNKAKDTSGCILVGENKKVGQVLNSKHWLQHIIDLINKALAEHDVVMIRITE